MVKASNQVNGSIARFANRGFANDGEELIVDRLEIREAQSVALILVREKRTVGCLNGYLVLFFILLHYQLSLFATCASNLAALCSCSVSLLPKERIACLAAYARYGGVTDVRAGF